MTAEDKCLVRQSHQLLDRFEEIIAVLGSIKEASNTPNEECITAEKERVFVALWRHVSHDEATVVRSVARRLHTAYAEVTDRHRLQVSHRVFFFQAGDV